MHTGKIRRTKQSEQERVSRHQLAELLESHGWVVDGDIQDLGEDFLIRIFDDGVWTGMAFFLQIKSTQDLRRNLVDDAWISYPFAVKDLLHWQDAATPVVLVVWDVSHREGVWASVDQAVIQLTAKRPDWRDKGHARVRIPSANKLDQDGLQRVRHDLARHYLPAVTQGKQHEFRFQLRFPPDDLGQGAHEALQRHFATGEQVRIDGKYIKDFWQSEWFTRLFGDVDFSAGHLKLGPAYSTEITRVRIDLAAEDGATACLPYVELANLRSGTEEVLLSNERRPSP